MLQTLVGVLIVVVLSNGMVLMGVPPSVQIGVQGLMIIVAVALSIDRKLMDRQMSAGRADSLLALRHISKSFPGVHALTMSIDIRPARWSG